MMLAADQTLPKLTAQYNARRSEIAARLAEIPALRKSIADLRAIIQAHRTAIVSEEDRTGPRLVAIAARLQAYLDSIEKLGRDVSSTDRALTKVQSASMGQIVEGFILLGVIAGMVGINLTLGHVAAEEAKTAQAKVALAQTIDDLKARGADAASIAALSGVYDGLGGTVAQTGATLIKLALVGGVGWLGYHFLTGKHHR